MADQPSTHHVGTAGGGVSVTLVWAVLLPAIAVVGTAAMQRVGDPTVTRLMLVLTAALPAIVLLDPRASRVHVAIATYGAALALLLHMALVSNYIWGFDINVEHYFAEGVLRSGSWDPSTPSNVNAMLSVVMLTPILTLVSGVPLTWTYKIIFPAIFAATPVVLFLAFSRMLTVKQAFFAVFFFVAGLPFYEEMFQLPRQQIGELAVACFLLVVLGEIGNSIQRSILVILCLTSLVVAHYGLAYLVLGILSVALLLLWSARTARKGAILSGGTFAIFVVALFGWYVYTSGGSAVERVALIGQNVGSTIWTQFFDARTTQGLAVLTSSISPLRTVTRGMHILAQGCIFIGVFAAVKNRTRQTGKLEFLTFAGGATVLLGMALAVPFFASALNASRIYQIALLFLSPYLVIGILFICQVAGNRIGIRYLPLIERVALWCLVIALAIFLLFNSGWVYEIGGEPPSSPALNADFDFPRFTGPEVAAASWVPHHISGSIRADSYRDPLLRSYVTGDAIDRLKDPPNMQPNDCFLEGRFNIEHGTLRLLAGTYTVFREPKYVQSEPFTSGLEMVYDSGVAHVFCKSHA